MNSRGIMSAISLVGKRLTRHPLVALFGGGLVSGAVCGAILPSWLLLISLVPLWIALKINQPKPNWNVGLLAITTLFFFPFYTVVMSWILDINVKQLIGVNQWVTSLLACMALLLSVLVLTVATLPGIYLLKWIQSKQLLGNYQTILAVACIWIISEWFRSVIFSTFLYGNGATLGDLWNFGSVGLVFINTPLKYISPIAGLYGLSFVVIIGSLVFYHLLRVGLNKSIVRTVSLLMLGLTLVSYLGYKLPNNKLALDATKASLFEQAGVQPSPRVGVEIINKQDDKKDIVLLPEGTDFYESSSSEATRSIQERLNSDGIALGVKYRESGNRDAALIARNKQGETVASQGKSFLIPIGEYLPWSAEGLLRLTSQSKSIELFKKNRAIQKSSDTDHVIKGNLPIGAVACSGILDRGVFRRLSNKGAQVFTNSASLSMFANSKNYLKQSYLMAMFHAVANKRVYIQSSKGGASFVIDADGQYIVKPIFDNQDVFEDFTFRPITGRSLYTIWGEWVLVLGTIFICMLFGFVYWKDVLVRRANK